MQEGGGREGPCGVNFICMLCTELPLGDRPHCPPYPPDSPAPPQSPARRGLLVTPKEHWPPFDGGLSMELVAPAGEGEGGGGRGGGKGD